jgi:ribosomal protein S12 methylthiotransferase accessory factor
MGIGLQVKGDGPTITVGLGADFDAAKAAKGALLEVGQVRPAFKQRLRMPQTQERLKKLLADPNNVEDLEDHDLLYGVPDKIQAFNFLFKQPVVDFNWNNQQEKTPAKQLQILIDFFAAEKNDLIYYNLTPPDMQQLGLYTTKVVIPDFQPIHFGHKNIRLGGNRLFELPQKLGFRNSRVRVDELNTNPHPLA